MGGAIPKQYLSLLGQAVLLHTLQRLCTHPRIDGVFAGIAPGDARWPALAPGLEGFDRFQGVFEGGAERADTVLNGLVHITAREAADTDWVLVHDAARPCVRHADISALIDDVTGSKDGGLLAVPLSDTVKRVNQDHAVVETVPRKGLWRALTPQMFHVGQLKAALAQGLKRGVEITDEASAVEHAGGQPRVVLGHADNIKITLPGDLELAELYLKRQQQEDA